MHKNVLVTLALTALLGASPVRIPSSLSLFNDWYPESMAIDSRGNFYVGSWHQGAVARVSPTGEMRVLVPSGSNGLTNTQGVVVDERHRTLWACSANFGYSTAPRKPSALKSFDLKTGAPKTSYSLPGGGLCNDMAIDARGDLYVTDSLHPRILRLAVGARSLTTWNTYSGFAVGPHGYTLNGIAVNDAHSLYVCLVNAVPYIFRVSIRADGSPGAVTKISMPRALYNADAIRTLGEGRLAIFETDIFGKNSDFKSTVSVAEIHDHGATIRTIASGLTDVPSGALFGGRAYYVQARRQILLASNPADARSIPVNVPFVIQSTKIPRAE